MNAAASLRAPTREQLRLAWRRMRTIRRFEERLVELVASGRLGGFLHLCTGQEAIAAGVCSVLEDRDWVASTHRGHGHAIARGVRVAAMMAELFGRSTGVCRGKGGSMHIADIDAGMLGANGIVGAGIPLATGAALSCRTLGTGGVAVAFFGDGASNQGQFHESLNLAAVWKLPAIYVVENNGWGEFTPTEFAVPVADIAARASSYGIASVIADGMDFFDVRAKAAEAVARARAGEGPTLLECKTCRYLGHYVGDPLAYRPAGEVETWRTTNDPLANFEARVVAEGLLGESDLREIDAEVDGEIEDAVALAEAAPPADVADLTRDVYVER